MYRPYVPEQQFLLPPSIADWVPDGSLARYIGDLVDELDGSGKLTSFYREARPDKGGERAYAPRLLLKVLLYGYCIGVMSSRRIAAALQNDVAFRFLAANQQPDFRTIAGFRKNHLEPLKALFVTVLDICREVGLAKVGRVALDGRKVQGNASRGKNRSKETLDAGIEELLKEAEAIDAREDAEFGVDKRGDELPEGLRSKEDRLKRFLEARERIAQREREARAEQEQKIRDREEDERKSGRPRTGRKLRSADEVVKKKDCANTTDPESQLLKGRQAWIQGYNAQAMADCGSQVIVAHGVTPTANDRRELAPMLTACETQAGALPTEVVADSGYWSNANAALQTKDLEIFTPTTKGWKHRKRVREAGYPRGPIPRDASPAEVMERKLLSQRGRAIYRERGSTIEAIFGQMVTRGLVRFLLRGFDKVRAEWSLWCTSHNILKLWRSDRHLAFA